MERSNRFQMRINSIRQKSNSKWKQISNIYSKFLIRFSWSILAFSSFVAIGLTVCFLLFMQIRSFDQNDFLMHNGKAMKNALRTKEIFGNDIKLRIHQQLNLYPALDIIIKRKLNTNETNMLNNATIQEIYLLDKQIQSMRINNTNNSIVYNYSSLCIKIDHACMIDGNYILTEQFYQAMSRLLPPKHGYYFDSSGSATGLPEFMFGKDYKLTNATAIIDDYDEGEDDENKDGDNDENNDIKTTTEAPIEKIISYVPLFRLRYSLNISTTEMHQLALQWEREVLRYLNEEYKSILLDLYPSTSTAITDVVSKKAHEEGLYMSLMVIIFFILFIIFLSIQGNFHTSVGYLPICGIVSIGLSTGATFGLLSLFGIQIIEPMALLIFIVIIIECMRSSIICGEYHRILKEHSITINDVTSEIDIEKILPSIIESTHPYFFISTVIISIIYFSLSIFSPMSSTKLICLTLSLYIFINYIIHLTFFSSCFVITLKRLSSRRHCLCCFRLSNDYYTKSKKKVSFNTKIFSFENFNIIFKKILSFILCLLLIIILIFSIYFTYSIDTRLFDDKFLPRDAYTLRKHMQSQVDDFNIGPVIMFTIPEEINYENEQIKYEINSLINKCHDQTRTNTFKLLWLETQKPNEIIHGDTPLNVRISPYSRNDLIVLEEKNHTKIIASRFYCQYKSIQGDHEDIQTMNNMYTYTNQSSIPSIFPYSLTFPNYESLQQIRIEMHLLIFSLILFIFLITFISFKISFLIILHILTLLTSTLTCLYLFHNLTFNFANALWLYVLPIVFIDTFIHICYNRLDSKWKYNRIIISLIISLSILYLFPIQSYVFQTIRNSLIYQSIICLLLINFILPSWFYLFQLFNKKIIKSSLSSLPPTIIEGNQSLTNGVDIKTSIYEVNRNINSSI